MCITHPLSQRRTVSVKWTRAVTHGPARTAQLDRADSPRGPPIPRASGVVESGPGRAHAYRHPRAGAPNPWRPSPHIKLTPAGPLVPPVCAKGEKKRGWRGRAPSPPPLTRVLLGPALAFLPGRPHVEVKQSHYDRGYDQDDAPHRHPFTPPFRSTRAFRDGTLPERISRY